MNRSDGLLMGGVVLLAAGLHRIEDNAVDVTRHDLTLRLRRRFVHGRRLIGDAFALALVFARVKTSVRATLDADGVTDRLGVDRVHISVDDAVNAILTEPRFGRVPDIQCGEC